MNLREFKAKLNKLVKEAYSLLEVTGTFDSVETNLRVDKTDPYKCHERQLAWEVLDSLMEFIDKSEYLLGKTLIKGDIRKNRAGDLLLNKQVLKLDTQLEIEIWSREFEQYCWCTTMLDQDRQGYFVEVDLIGEEEPIRHLAGKKARIKETPPIRDKRIW